MDEGDKKPVSISTIKEGNVVVIDDAACKVTDIQSGKAGKHGHAKVRLVAVGIIDGKRREIVMPGGESIDVPIIDKRNAQILSVAGKKANVMDSETFETFDLDIPDELEGQIKEGMTIVYWIILNAKVMKQIKTE